MQNNILENISLENIRSFLHTKNFFYDTKKFNFREILEDIYGCNLSNIHLYLGDFKRFERFNDQSTLAHKVFYSSFKEKIKPLYELFIKEYIAKIINPHKFYYQVIPTFRIGLPGNTFVGEYHKDSNYNHQSYELNFNLGLANYEGQAALRSELTPESDKWTTLESPYGSIFSFDHIDCKHGSEPNETNKTMVSMDFRLALKELYFDTEESSVNLKTKFKPGYYFSKEFLNK